jgi:acyl-CoA synthetase (AMP-forming)/AMP-acid ligase II
MVIVGGFNVYPAEVEAALCGHPDVHQAAVVGVPDDRLGEVPAAFVVPAAGRRPSGEDLLGWCRERLANFKVPRQVRIVEALPLNAAGKVDKPALRDSSGGRLAPEPGR